MWILRGGLLASACTSTDLLQNQVSKYQWASPSKQHPQEAQPWPCNQQTAVPCHHHTTTRDAGRLHQSQTNACLNGCSAPSLLFRAIRGCRKRIAKLHGWLNRYVQSLERKKCSRKLIVGTNAEVTLVWQERQVNTTPCFVEQKYMVMYKYMVKTHKFHSAQQEAASEFKPRGFSALCQPGRSGCSCCSLWCCSGSG